MKIKLTKEIKYQGEKYVFKNGVAKVPGLRFGREQATITLTEFHELSKEVKE